MSWVTLAILSHFFWAIVNIGDKYVVDKKVNNSFVYFFALGLLNFFFLPFIFSPSLPVPAFSDFIYILSASIFILVGTIFYFLALEIEDVSRINIWWQLIPVFSLIIEVFFLRQFLPTNQLIAFFVLVFGGVLASFGFRGGRWHISRAFFYMIITGIFFALYAIIINHIGSNMSSFYIWVWMNIIIFFLCLACFLLKKVRISVTPQLLHLDRVGIIAIFMVYCLDNLANYFNISALARGPVSLVFSMEGWQIIFVFLLAFLISKFLPRIIREDFSPRNTAIKVVSMFIMLVGIWVMYYL